MTIPGLETILEQEPSVVWRGEETPDPDVVSAFQRAELAIDVGHFDKAIELLDDIARREPTGSQEMRLRYWQGNALMGKEEFAQASRFYDQALHMATTRADYDTMVALTIAAAKALHYAYAARGALEYYRIGYDMWLERLKERSCDYIEPTVALLTYMARQLWWIGEFDEAHAKLGAALALVSTRDGEPQSGYLIEMTAQALWMLALTLRAQSDMRDGDLGFVETALARMRTATEMLQAAGTADNNLARCYIQLAEMYLDSAELRYRAGEAQEAQKALRAAFIAGEKAEQFLEPRTDEDIAKMMAHITLVRHSITAKRPSALLNRAEETSAVLNEIDMKSAALHDEGLVAGAATLRAGWLIGLGNLVEARTILKLAIQGFQNDRMGMAHRAQRLLREIDGTSDPR